MVSTIIIGSTIGGVIALILIICAFAWYRIVPPSEAHLVVTPKKKMVCSSDPKIQKDGGSSTYFAIPKIPGIGRTVRVMDVTIKELVLNQETIEEGQARYAVKSSTKYKITDVQTASETSTSDEDLEKQLEEVIKASVRAVTVKYDVIKARSEKQKMAEEVTKEMKDDFAKWGIELVNFQLVDFQDVVGKDGKVISSIISDISRRREVEIETQTRERNAEKYKQAKVKEAESDEVSQKREIMRDEEVAKREQEKEQTIQTAKKLAEEKRFEVVKVQTIKQAEIDKEKAIVEANQKREQEEIMKQQKKLEGEGDRLKEEEQAKGAAAPIREKGLAEAEAKEKLQVALNKFGDEAIRALVAEKIVEMQQAVGVAGAKALENADVRLFGGGDSSGFDIGKMISSMAVANEGSANATLNKLARPNDVGLSVLGLESIKDKKETKINKPKKEQLKK